MAAGATGKPVNVKKGQWMHPEGMRGARRQGAARLPRRGTVDAARR